MESTDPPTSAALIAATADTAAATAQPAAAIALTTTAVAVAAAAVAAVTWKLGSETVLVFGPESVSYERSRRENRTILREISARVFFWKNLKN